MRKDIAFKQSNLLILLGLLLFLLGLIAGLFVQQLPNPRMALAAHLEGLMNGIFLVLMGLIWRRLQLADFWRSMAFGLLVYGSFANLVAVLLAAATGYGKMMPIAGGREGKGPAESLISFLLVSLSISMLIACIVVIIGFCRSMNKPSTVLEK
ncbi:MAG TPA: hypothetical protein VFS31_05335 [Chitinophagaceae bacterium]|nr:hypothetical protein [Chitinophagaceae bacterium]